MAQAQVDPNQQNLIARQMVLNSAINMWQSIYTQSFTTGPGTIINIPLRNVGLIKRLVVEITATVARSAAETQTLSAWGPANFLSQIILTDLSNQTRINTSGWHMHALATARRQWAFGSAYSNDSPVDINSNFPVIVAPASFTTGSQTVRMFYEIPVAYGDFDLRGAIYANVVNATMNLQLNVNPGMFVTSTGDDLLAMYKSSSTDLAAMSTFQVNVYQNYLDQIPITQNGPVLPILDLSTAYLLNNTVMSGLVANQDNPLPYANFRNFMSTIVIYNNNGTRNTGSDINYWSIQSANYTNILKYDPYMASLMTREIISDDFPAGTYYFDHRQRPISTIQYGNMQLIMNPITVGGAAANALVGYEALALINQVTQAGSLYGT